jgi:hypothetical protein
MDEFQPGIMKIVVMQELVYIFVFITVMRVEIAHHNHGIIFGILTDVSRKLLYILSSGGGGRKMIEAFACTL